ncbi:hypothetical protein OUZ56_032236 [Daphnia magna]|uniref:Uncharacterized protein n=1 Tax=Daphnia magna TaxID=35525 RepID=A0ABQ9ZXK5_9CRUS|nr:hypothetical protein OUZ56_032236 [Daphnia magna]
MIWQSLTNTLMKSSNGISEWHSLHISGFPGIKDLIWYTHSSRKTPISKHKSKAAHIDPIASHLQLRQSIHGCSHW